MGFNFFAPKPGRFGIAPVFIKSGQIGGTNFLGGTTPITAGSGGTPQTTIFRLGGVAGRRARIDRIGATVVTVPVSAGGTIVATIRKYDASADSVVTISQNLELTTLTTREEGFANPIATLTDSQLTLDAGDALEVHVVSSHAIGTQPAGLVFTASVMLLD